MAGVYVHVPLCASKCWYCDFYSMPQRDAGVAPRLVDALIAELRSREDELAGSPVRTIYIGGGTPSSLPLRELERLIAALRSGHDVVEEFTVEVNPEDVDGPLARMLARAGVNRVSMGIQSLVDTELKAVGRRHDAARGLDAVAALREAGITNISVDLIFGLPGQTLGSWRQSVEGLMALDVPHFSAYLLSYEQGTRLWAQLQAGKIAEASDELVNDMWTLLTDTARAQGYRHYEISSYCRPGFHSRHNSSYWDMTPYLGIGPGAHSFDGRVRRSVPASLKAYLAAGGVGLAEVEDENDIDRANDMIITALRTDTGLDVDSIESRFRPQLQAAADAELAAGRLVAISPGRYAIPESRWLTADTTLRNLFLI